MRVTHTAKNLFRILKGKKWLLGLIFTFILVFGFLAWDFYSAKRESGSSDSTKTNKEEPTLFAAPFSGLKTTKEQLSKRPIAVIIENHPDARPQSGLNEADFVFEAVAEGGITRFLALYHSQEVVSEIGPVRSARPYYVEWADSYDALFAFVGGSEEALTLIERLNVSALNQFFLGNYFWRDNRRFAPHNVYTTTQKLREAAVIKKQSATKEEISGYTFKEDAPFENRPQSQRFTIGLNFGYAPTYSYDPSCNCYSRSLLGVLQKDRVSRENITAKNVIVAFAQTGTQSLRNTTYTTVRTTGEGQAHFFQDGKQVKGTWKRSAGNPIRFFGPDNKEIKLNVGTTWVTVVDIGTNVQILTP